MKLRRCPKCHSLKWEMFAGFVTGTYHCRECGYIGPFLEEIDLSKKVKTKRKKARKKRT
jgi:uncharacterized protein (DUF983 family)